MADVKASQPQPQAEAEQQEQPTSEVVGEPSPLARQYEEMKAKHQDCLMLFRCGDFYAALGEDGAAVAEICGLALTRNEQAQDITREQCAFPAHALDSYLPRLVRAGKRVAICDQLAVPEKKSRKRSTKKAENK